MSATILDVRGVSVALGGRTILSDVSLSVAAGELVAVVGPNGAGKTTLMRAAAGLVARTAGEVSIGGTALDALSLRERAVRVAYLPQGHVFHWPLAVADVVALGRLPRGAGADLSAADRAAVNRAMAETGIAEYGSRAVTTLSGGERARVAIARVLATEAPLLLADEPTASLDPRYQMAVIEMLRRHASGEGAVVAVLHDLALAARHADRVVVVDGGRIVADGPPRAVLTPRLLAATFGVNADVVDMRGSPVIVPWSLSGSGGLEASPGVRTGVAGFAILCMAALPRGRPARVYRGSVLRSEGNPVIFLSANGSVVNYQWRVAGVRGVAAMDDFAGARTKMVDLQLRTENVTDYAILTAMGAVPRELFVPPTQRALAYLDKDIPIKAAAGGAPRYLMEAAPFARLLQLAEIEPDDAILDIGCGSGYSAAVLARLSRFVVALESDASLAAEASQRLNDLNIDNVKVAIGPLEAGYPSDGPYDVIFIDGAVEVLPAALFGELKDGGRLVAVVGYGRSGVATVCTKSDNQIGRRAAFNADVRPLPGFSKPPAFVF